MTTPELKPYQARSNFKHGHAARNGQVKYTPTYQSWQCMIARCRYPNRDTEGKYAKRGIRVANRWKNFENFISDMGERPKGTTLDRIDNSRGYEPGNFRWSNPVEQARNRRNKRLNYEQALDIAKRMLAGERACDLAREYGISESLPREIHKGRTWRDAYHAARES